MTQVLASEASLAALDHVPIGALILREDRVVIFWNRQLEEWTGLAREQILESRIDEHFPQLADDKYAERLRQVFEGGAPVIFSSQLHRQVIPSTLPNGTPRIQHTTVTAIPAPSSEDFFALFAIQDVTDLTARIEGYWQMRDSAIQEAAHRALVQKELQQAYKELEQRVLDRTAELSAANAQLKREIAERQQAEDQLRAKEAQLAHVSRLSTMGELVAGIAHEINQPLYAMANFAAVAEKKLEAIDCEQRRSLQELNRQISDQAVRAGHIIRQLRTFVRKSDGERSPCEINAVVRDAVAIMSPLARRTVAYVRLQLVDRPVFVHANRIQLEQVVVNLIRNAVEAVAKSDHREVTIRTALTEEIVKISVEDTGAGIPEGDLARLFDAFFTTKESGLGMGLAISRTIVDAHDGRIWVDAGSKGGMIHFTLPLHRSDQHVETPRNHHRR